MFFVLDLQLFYKFETVSKNFTKEKNKVVVFKSGKGERMQKEEEDSVVCW